MTNGINYRYSCNFEKRDLAGWPNPAKYKTPTLSCRDFWDGNICCVVCRGQYNIGYVRVCTRVLPPTQNQVSCLTKEVLSIHPLVRCACFVVVIKKIVRDMFHLFFFSKKKKICPTYSYWEIKAQQQYLSQKEIQNIQMRAPEYFRQM